MRSYFTFIAHPLLAISYSTQVLMSLGGGVFDSDFLFCLAEVL